MVKSKNPVLYYNRDSSVKWLIGEFELSSSRTTCLCLLLTSLIRVVHWLIGLNKDVAPVF